MRLFKLRVARTQSVLQFICKMNTNRRITGSKSSLTLTGDNTKTCTLCWASKGTSGCNRWGVLSEKSFLMGLLLLLLKARPLFLLVAGNRIDLFVIITLPASPKAQTCREHPCVHPWQHPQKVPGLWIYCVTRQMSCCPCPGTCCWPWPGERQAPSQQIRQQEKPIILLT